MGSQSGEAHTPCPAHMPCPSLEHYPGVLEPPQLASSLAGTQACPMAPCSQLCPDTLACTLAHHPSTYMHVCTHIIQTHHGTRWSIIQHTTYPYTNTFTAHWDQCSGEPAFPSQPGGPLTPEPNCRGGPPGTCPHFPYESSCKSRACPSFPKTKTAHPALSEIMK